MWLQNRNILKSSPAFHFRNLKECGSSFFELVLVILARTAAPQEDAVINAIMFSGIKSFFSSIDQF